METEKTSDTEFNIISTNNDTNIINTILDYLNIIHVQIIEWLKNPLIFAIVIILLILIIYYISIEKKDIRGFYYGDEEFKKTAEIEQLYCYISPENKGILVFDDDIYHFTVYNGWFTTYAIFDEPINDLTDFNIVYDINDGYIKFSNDNEIYGILYKNHEISNNIRVE